MSNATLSAAAIERVEASVDSMQRAAGATDDEVRAAAANYVANGQKPRVKGPARSLIMSTRPVASAWDWFAQTVQNGYDAGRAAWHHVFGSEPETEPETLPSEALPKIAANTQTSLEGLLRLRSAILQRSTRG